MRRQLLLVTVATAACSKGADRPPMPPSTDAEEQQLMRQCDEGTDAACEQLEGRYLEAKRPAEVTALVKRLCEGGRRYFCPTYAFILAVGDNVPRDRGRALQLFNDTCKDDPRGCSEYGNLFIAGLGVPKDLDLGCILARHACTHGDQDACRDLEYCTGP